MEKDRAYTLSQVSQHNLKQDCWFTINGKVLDVTRFIEEHPGGEEVLIEHAGKDASKAFEHIGHSKEAYNLLSRFQLGYLKGYNVHDQILDHEFQLVDNQILSTNAKKMEAYVIKGDPEPKTKTVNFVEFFVPVLVASLYFGYRCMAYGVVAE